MEKALVIIPRTPYPLNAGGKILIFQHLRILQKVYYLNIVIIEDEFVSEQTKHELRHFFRNVTWMTIPKWRCYLNSAKSLYNGNALQENYFFLNKINKFIKAQAANADFVYFSLIRSFKYARELEKPIIFNAIDSIYLSYSKSRESTRSVFWKAIYNFELKRLFKAENAAVKLSKLSLFVNPEEAKFWSRVGNSINIPLGVEKYQLRELTSETSFYSNRIVFLGKMNYQPNIDAVEWFTKNVFPSLDPELEFWIIGAQPTKMIKNLDVNPRIKVLGYVEDLNEILDKCLCTVSPMQTGGGIQTKILTGMSRGCLTVISNLAARPIVHLRNNENCFIEDDSIKICELINQFYTNNSNFYDVKLKAVEMVAKNYTWESLGEILLSKIRGNLN